MRTALIAVHRVRPVVVGSAVHQMNSVVMVEFAVHRMKSAVLPETYGGAAHQIKPVVEHLAVHRMNSVVERVFAVDQDSNVVEGNIAVHQIPDAVSKAAVG